MNQPSPACSLLAAIKQAFPDLGGLALRKAFRCTFLYVCRKLNFSQFRTAMREFEQYRQTEFKVFRLALTEHFYYYGTLRYVGLWFVTTPKATVAQCLAFGVKRADADGLAWLKRNCKLVGEVRRYCRAAYGPTVPRPDEVRELCGKVLSGMHNSILTIVRSKLKFLTIFNRLDEGDLAADLTIRVVQQFMWAFRNRDWTYQHQYMLMVAHNAARNMAHYWTTAKRHVASIQDADGISTRVLISENEGLVNPIASVAAPDVSPESDYDARRIVIMYGTTDRRRKLLAVLSGAENLDFTCWLRQHKLISNSQTNEDGQLSLPPDVYLHAAIRWAKVNRKHATRFIKTMRREHEPKCRTYS